MTEFAAIIEGQLRECYGRVVYTHKTHEKCADILFEKHKQIKLLQILLSAIVTGGILSTFADGVIGFLGAVFGTLISTVLLALNAYTKDYDLGEIAQKHRQAAADIWLIREEYLSLLTNLRADLMPVAEITQRRDDLLKRLHTIYSGAPSTNYKAYVAAQKALQKMEDMTFSDSEIDAFLPRELKRGIIASGSLKKST
ncbi:SLATT domain-containing protein [Xanthomonas arboricola]|uniref:SLATT domain-containing protein n=1 Tax=Xanthomonas arboricola TaxID=56448 RepID=UPI000C8179AF|nr:SLATT domain-containing protein [Xanthomonas arboricola]SOT93565.1 hypothetical protein CFBP6773_00248 [Xanthomonas arboricola pv. fragariae]